MLNEYPFTVAANAVRILDGADEGSFAWVRSADALSVIHHSHTHPPTARCFPLSGHRDGCMLLSQGSLPPWLAATG